MGERLFDVAVVARIFDVSPSTVRHWIAVKKVYAIRQPCSGYYKIPASELQRLKESRESQQPKVNP